MFFKRMRIHCHPRKGSHALSMSDHFYLRFSHKCTQFLSLLLVIFLFKYFEYQIFSCLERSLETIRKECHWLRSVSWDLCAQCRLCAGKVDSNTRRCIWHNRERCSHDDCAHYIALKSSQYFCPHAKSGHAFLPKERYEHWLQVR